MYGLVAATTGTTSDCNGALKVMNSLTIAKVSTVNNKPVEA